MAQMNEPSIALSGVSGPQLAAFTNTVAAALNSGNIGVSRPQEIAKGGLWSKQVSNEIEIYCFDGSEDVLIGAVSEVDDEFRLASSTSFGRSLMAIADEAAARAAVGAVLEPITSQVVVAGSVGAIVFEIPQEFSGFHLAIQDYFPTVNGTALLLQLGTGTAVSPTWQTSYDEATLVATSTNVFSSASTTTSAALTGDVTNLIAAPNLIEATVRGMNAATTAQIAIQAGYVASPSQQRFTLTGTVVQNASVARTVARVVPTQGTISDIRLQVYGVRAF